MEIQVGQPFVCQFLEKPTSQKNPEDISEPLTPADNRNDEENLKILEESSSGDETELEQDDGASMQMTMTQDPQSNQGAEHPLYRKSTSPSSPSSASKLSSAVPG